MYLDMKNLKKEKKKKKNLISQFASQQAGKIDFKLNIL